MFSSRQMPKAPSLLVVLYCNKCRGVPPWAPFLRKEGGHFQLTTDGLNVYPDAVAYSLGTRVDYAQLIKVYGKNNREGEQSIRNLRW